MATWRFIHLSDPHLGSETDDRWHNHLICSRMPEVVSRLRREFAPDPPDFIMATGDLTGLATRDGIFAARDLLDSLGTPYYPLGGEHDFAGEQCRAWFIEAFGAHLPGSETFYSFTHKNLHVCVLDPWWRWADRSLSPWPECNNTKGGWTVPPHQLEWLEDDLRTHRASPALVFLHPPVAPVPERLRRPEYKDAGCLDNGATLVAVLKSHRQVLATFAGHAHMHYAVEDSGLMHVVTCALAEYPVEYREILVYEDRIEVRTHGVQDDAFASESLIEGREWVAGEECDRTFEIRFPS